MTDAAAHAAANAEQLRVLREALTTALPPVSASAPSTLQCPASSPTGQRESPDSNSDQGSNPRGISLQGLPEKKDQP
ncbi:hypothetical protein [Deinococcus aquatilis]|uniref:hypothetical protein n=1 Tax=Deinococcus aquatilis TaxID=519440 RepID=UPI0012FB16FD|nr:hypothetical protein [Deinococcus aquatilis]